MEEIKDILVNLDSASFGFGIIFCMIMDCFFAFANYWLQKAFKLRQDKTTEKEK